ncbi:hypothetical protein SH139x_004607 [Planctomycetaceae bacterium SH139]
MLTKKSSFVLFSLFFIVVATTATQTTIAKVTVAAQSEEGDHSQVVIMVPNVSCYGRFHDSLKEHIQNKHDWIHNVRIRNTERVRNPYKSDSGLPETIQLKADESPSFDIGTIAELAFTIDSSRSTRDLLKAIRDSKQYSLKGWKVQVEVDIEDMLAK